MDRRRYLAAVGTAAAIAGCSSGDGGDEPTDEAEPEDTPTESPTDTATETPAETETATGTPGENEEQSNVEPSVPDPLKIGVLAPEATPLGASILRAAQLRAEEYNANGGIAGSSVEVITGDTRDDPNTARSRYLELVEGEGVHATMGVFSSDVQVALMDTIAESELVHLATGAQEKAVTEFLADDFERYRNLFRVGPMSTAFLGESVLRFAEARFADMGWERVALLAEDFEWTDDLVADVSANIESRAGVELVAEEVVSEGRQDFNPIYDRFESANVDGVVTGLAHTGTSALVQWAKSQREFGFGGVHIPTAIPSYYDATQGAAIATFSYVPAVANAGITPKTKPFAEAFRSKHDRRPTYTGYVTADAMGVLKAAVERAGTVALDPLVTELEATNHTGTTGQIRFFGRDADYPHDAIPSFAAEGEGLANPYFQWQTDDEGNGVQRPIHPDGVATGTYQSPPWN